ncbi:LysR family transcriptional regulator [Shewanella sp. Scap07]|uniref:LysR substrate-binding domain-containing protein n=1 Tax=Shewanella sp. Scap07 TaxID=2589987 RepID=UPI0015BF707C|nr:LysR substrate-binding domain-containing protein [Shewanella sp. Scap07]QLE86617.1 LysR family transcriptional regulator [Shewanella sp. Scap07]
MLSKSLKKISDLDVFSLIVFKVLYENGYANNTANELQVSAPKVSRCLASLRATFDDELFYRRQQGLKPTPLAEMLYKPICDVYQTISQLEQVAQYEPASDTVPVINIAVAKNIMTSLAIAIEQHPKNEVLGKIRLQQWVHNSQEWIHNGEVDFGIALESCQSSELSCEYIGTHTKLYLAAKKDHPIWDNDTTITLEAIANHPFTYLESKGFNDRVDPLEMYCKNARVDLLEVDKVNNREELISHLLTMGSVAFTPALDAQFYTNIPTLRTEILAEEQFSKLHQGLTAPQYYIIEKQEKNRRYNEERRQILFEIVTNLLQSS